MDYREIPASPPFDQLIHCVWFLGGSGVPYLPQTIVPDGRIELLVHLADPFFRSGPDGSPKQQDALLVAGQLTRPLLLSPGSRVDVVGVRLNPPGAHAILGVPLCELNNDVIPLGLVNRTVAEALHAAAASCGTCDQRARAIMVALGRCASAGPDPHMSTILRSIAATPIGNLVQLARGHGMSKRTMERRFRNEVGVGPKTFQQVVRFRRAFRMLSVTEPGGWARVAANAGYYDQAHLIRDFRRFAGTSPRRFFLEDPTLAQAFSSPLTTDAPHGEIDPSGAIFPRSLDSSDE